MADDHLTNAEYNADLIAAAEWSADPNERHADAKIAALMVERDRLQRENESLREIAASWRRIKAENDRLRQELQRGHPR